MSTLGNNLLAQYYAQQNFGPRSNEVWYYADAKVTLYSETNVVSHEFADGKGVITYISSLESMPNSLRGTAITGVVMSSRITSIISNAFVNCANLVVEQLNGKITSIGEQAFFGCSSLNIKKLPSNITRLDTNTFRNAMTPLSSLPDGLTYIGSSVFEGSSGLALTILPPSLKTVGNRAFIRCINIAINEIPPSITTISTQAFLGCTGITELNFKGIPSSIDATAFAQCANLTTIRVPWSEGEVANAPWGATNATIVYNYQP